MKFSIKTLLIAVTLCCLVLAVAREAIFPPAFRVYVISPKLYQIDGIDVTKAEIKSRLSEFSTKHQDNTWPAKFEVVMPADMSGPKYDDDINEMCNIGFNRGFSRVYFPRDNNDDPLGDQNTP